MQEISADILIKASTGDLKAFEEVYRMTAGFVYNVAFRIVKNNREDAQEVTQEVFLRIHSQLKNFRFESSFKTWMYRIAVNCSINFVNGVGKMRNKEIEFDESKMQPTVNNIQQGIDRESHEKTVEDLLGTLNADQRACVVLRSVEGLSYEKIAQALNININTVRSRLKRARERLLTLRKQVDYGRM